MYYRNVAPHAGYRGSGYYPAPWPHPVVQPRFVQPFVVPHPLVVQRPVVGVHHPHEGFLIEVNRYFAGRLGMNPRHTISTNVAYAISRATGLRFVTAKRLFHGGVAGFVAAVLHAFGIGIAATLGAGALLWSWLESYDNSAYRR